MKHTHATANTLAQRFITDTSGSVAIIVGVSIVTLSAIVAGAVEMSNYTQKKAEFRNAVDQAVMSVAAKSAGANSSQVELSGMNFLKANLPESLANASALEFTVTPTNAERTAWKATASVEVPTVMGGLLGYESTTAAHEAGVEWDKSVKTELVAVVDVSGTMCADIESVDQEGKFKFIPDKACKKLNMMERALTGIVDIGVAAMPNDPVFKVGVVPFSFQVRLPENRGQNVPTLAPFLLDQETSKSYYTDFTDAENNGPALPATFGLKTMSTLADKQAFTQYIDSLASANKGEFNRMAWKRSALGAQMAGLMLDPRYTALFGGETPNALGAEKTRKIVILMTDSVNMGCCFTNWPQNNFTGNYTYSYSEDHKHLVGADNKKGVCKLMKEAGVEIYTILLGVDENQASARGEEIINAFETCASKPGEAGIVGGGQHAFRIPANDEEALKNAYEVIGNSLVNLRLSY